MWAGTPWLFPSLGPTIAIQSASPEAQSARPLSVLGGHLIGLAAGFTAVFITGAASTPSVVDAHRLSGQRVGASVLAVLLSMLVQHFTRLEHPPAQATTLLLALGALQADASTAVTVIAGVLLIIVLGEGVRLALFPKKKQ